MVRAWPAATLTVEITNAGMGGNTGPAAAAVWLLPNSLKDTIASSALAPSDGPAVDANIALWLILDKNPLVGQSSTWPKSAAQYQSSPCSRAMPTAFHCGSSNICLCGGEDFHAKSTTTAWDSPDDRT